MELETMQQVKTGVSQDLFTKTFLVLSSLTFLFAGYFALVPLPVKSPQGNVPAVRDKDPLKSVSTKTVGKMNAREAIERFRQLAKADNIVVAKVTNKENEIVDRSGRKIPYTKYTLTVLGKALGMHTIGSDMTIRHYGGDLGNNKSEGTRGMPALSVGQSYLLFLRENPEPKTVNVSPIIGLSEGIFPIIKENNQPAILDYSGQPVNIMPGKVVAVDTPVSLSTTLGSIARAVNADAPSIPEIELSSLPTREGYAPAGEYSCGSTWIDNHGTPIDIYPNYTFGSSVTGNPCDNNPNTPQCDYEDRMCPMLENCGSDCTCGGTGYPDGPTQENVLRQAIGEWEEVLGGELSFSIDDEHILQDPLDYDGSPIEMNWNGIIIGNLPISEDWNGFTSCSTENGKTAAAVIVMNNGISWDYRTGTEAIEYYEQKYWAAIQERVENYEKTLIHELGHDFGRDHLVGNPQQTNAMTVMFGGAIFMPKIWGFDRTLINQNYNITGTPQVNVYSTNWKIDHCTSTVCLPHPVDQTPENAEIGATVPFEYHVGNEGSEPVQFKLGVYWVTSSCEYENPDCQIFLKSIPISLGANDTRLGTNTFVMPQYSGTLMLIADYDNQIAEDDETDNGQNWPRLNDFMVPIDGGWLSLKTSVETGGDWNAVSLKVDEIGPPAQAELKYSLVPWQPTDAWFAQATSVPLPPLDAEHFPPNSTSDITLTGLQNDRVYYLGLRQVRNGYTDWEYNNPETGVVEFDAIDTHACALRVTSLDGGETVTGGNPVNITWERTGRCTSGAKLELSRNGSVCSVITANTANDGRYLWTASQCGTNANQYKIKVTDLGTNTTDASDNVFTVAAPNSYDVRNASFKWDFGMDFFPNFTGDNATADDHLPDGWQQGSWPGVIDGTISHSGSTALKIEKSGDNGGRAWVAQDIPITVGKRYRLSGWVKTDCWDDACYGTVHAQCLGASHNAIWSNCGLNIPLANLTKVTGQHDWQYISYTLEANNANARFLRAMCYHTPQENGTNGTGTVWCDDLKLEDTTPGGGGKYEIVLPPGNE